ncbi:MAG: M48 family metalloprotease [Patescibacteria group bacterium]
MASLYTHQDSNIRRTWFLMSVFFAVVIALGWYFSYALGNGAILYGAVIFSILMNVVSYWYSDKIVLSMSGARPVAREENRELWNIVENLSITAGLPMPELYIIDDPAPNAFATGRDKEHAVVAVTSGLTHMLDRNELEGVIAHELSHIGNRDILLSTVVVVLVGFVALLSDFFLRANFWGGRSRDDKASGIMMLIGIILAILSPLIATLIQLAISRKREFLADASGALLTRYPDGLATALEKIGSYSQPMRRVSNATAHLFISNPFGLPAPGTAPARVSAGGRQAGGAVKKVATLFMTHPPIKERVRALRDIGV